MQKLKNWLKKQIFADEILHETQKKILLDSLDSFNLQQLQNLEKIFAAKNKNLQNIQKNNAEFFNFLFKKARGEMKNFENSQRENEISAAENLLENL